MVKELIIKFLHKYLIYIVLILILFIQGVGLYFMHKKYVEIKNDNLRNQENLIQITDGIKKSILKNGEKNFNSGVAIVKENELLYKQFRYEMRKHFDFIKSHNLYSGQQTGIIWHDTFAMKLIDSTLYDTVKVRCIEPIKTDFWQISGCNGYGMKVIHFDTLYQVVTKHSNKEKFINWLQFWKKKRIWFEQDIQTADTSARVFYNKKIILK